MNIQKGRQIHDFTRKDKQNTSVRTPTKTNKV